MESVTSPRDLVPDATSDPGAASRARFVGPVAGVGVGVVAPYDFALDRELWRWVPGDATLHLIRTAYSPLPVTVEQAELIGDIAAVAQCTKDLIAVEPKVMAYACTSGSFVAGRAGERALVSSMLESGAAAAITTSGALVEALAYLGVTRLAVATPYDAAVTARLHDFLEETGVSVTRSAHLGLSERIWTVPYAVTAALIRDVAAAGCEAVFVSCTNLPTYDIVTPLEAELGIPVLTANQVTMWACLRRVALAAVGPGQSLLHSDSPVRQRDPA
jgi:maleate isomerase